MHQDSNDIVISTLAARYPAIQTLIAAARDLLLTAFPEVTETADLKAGLISYSYGPGYKGVVATLILSKGGVKIGIPYGATLEDPAGLLKGNGKVHRHIAITSVVQLADPAVADLVQRSLDAWRQRSRGA